MKVKKTIVFAVAAALAVAVVPLLLPTGPAAGLGSSELLSAGRLWVGGAVVFLGGLLTALTPCVYPLIPITVGLFGARRADARGKSVLLTCSYVLGMAAVFTILGVVAARTGQAFGSILGDPRFAIGLAIFLGVLAASMFGAFELAIPSGLAQRLNAVGGAGLAGAFLMGTVAGFLAAPCTGPVLAGLLAFVAKSQSIALGAALLFVYALGIGVPFVLIGVFALRLPKGGAWMEWVKSVLGVALLALAANYVKDAIPSVREAVARIAQELGRAPGTWIAAALAALGVLLGGVQRSFKEGRRDFALKAAGVLLLVGALVFRGAALNAPVRGMAWAKFCAPLQENLNWRVVPSTGPSSSGLSGALLVTVCRLQPESAPELKWQVQFPSSQTSTVHQFDAALQRARESGRPVMIDFGAEWCAACKELERDTYVDPTVVSEATRFVNIKVDGTNEVDEVEALYQRFGVQGLPTVAFISSKGEVLADPRVTGFLRADKFLAELRKVR
ncbi:MAG TPA: cytochrome c biogenesis protein CcdA [Myxococcaceae bacterium]|nr:cytochrome c biogenesis protein CcdA [Myxococcaceae bacterium]